MFRASFIFFHTMVFTAHWRFTLTVPAFCVPCLYCVGGLYYDHHHYYYSHQSWLKRYARWDWRWDQTATVELLYCWIRIYSSFSHPNDQVKVFMWLELLVTEMLNCVRVFDTVMRYRGRDKGAYQLREVVRWISERINKHEWGDSWRLCNVNCDDRRGQQQKWRLVCSVSYNLDEWCARRWPLANSGNSAL